MRAGGILSSYPGVRHDHWASYLQFPDCQHAFCNVHHLRELRIAIRPSMGRDGPLVAHHQGRSRIDRGSVHCLAPRALDRLRGRHDALIAQGLAANPPPAQTHPRPRGRPKQWPKNLLDLLLKHKSGVLAFMYDFRIPFDNNQAERDVRMIKVQQKVSGAFRTLEGADTFCARFLYLNRSQTRPQCH